MGLMCCWHCYCVLTRLGIVDDCVVAALGLPKSTDSAKLDARGDISRPVEGLRRQLRELPRNSPWK